LSRPFSLSPVGWRIRRPVVTPAQPKRVWLFVPGRKRRVSVRF
jgi:hypothetical protein